MGQCEERLVELSVVRVITSDGAGDSGRQAYRK